MASITMWGIVMGIIALLVIVAAIFMVPKIGQANELLNKHLGKYDIFLPHEIEEAQDRFKENFEGLFLNGYSKCIDSDKKSCWCNFEDFNMPNGFYLRFFQHGSSTKLNLLNNRKADFLGFPYEFSNIHSCVIIDEGTFNIEDLKNEEFFIQKGDPSLLELELKQPIEISSGQTPVGGFDPSTALQYSPISYFQKEVDLEKLFYKYDENRICVVDKESINKLKTEMC